MPNMLKMSRLVLASSVFLFSCGTSPGPVGPPGKDGDPGPTGSQGPTGPGALPVAIYEYNPIGGSSATVPNLGDYYVTFAEVARFADGSGHVSVIIGQAGPPDSNVSFSFYLPTATTEQEVTQIFNSSGADNIVRFRVNLAAEPVTLKLTTAAQTGGGTITPDFTGNTEVTISLTKR